MAKLYPAGDRARIDALLVVSPWEYEQILRLNAEVARIEGKEVQVTAAEQHGVVALALGVHQPDKADEAERFCRKGLCKILHRQIVQAMVGQTVQVVVDRANREQNMAYDA